MTSVFVSVPKDTLGPEAEVTFIWKTDAKDGDLDGWKSKVEVKVLGSDEWVEVGSADAIDGKLMTKWDDKAIGAFESRITLVKDKLASNSMTTNWAPHVFSTAILTRTVKCLFCHIRIEGDVGGIDFPSSMHAGAATGVRILGELFSTNEIPEVFKTGPQEKGAVTQRDMFENYANEGKTIFPKPQEGGIVDFPEISQGALAAKMLGRLVSHESQNGAKGTTISKIHKGHLFIDGTEKAFEISGEVFVEGDLVIKGKYTGQGTIYAQNIFIIGDVTAKSSPFPFLVDEEKALEHARDSIAKRDDALYLAALNQISVGEFETPLGEAAGVAAVVPTGAFEAVGSEAKFFEIAQKALGPDDYIDGTPGEEPWTFKFRMREDGSRLLRIDVQRVDAFLFANEAIVWRSHGNWLLNGGFISPKAAMTSRMQIFTGSWWCSPKDAIVADAPDAKPDNCGRKKAELINPRNGLPSHTNVIRFDYRLRAGGLGFDSIRDLF